MFRKSDSIPDDALPMLREKGLTKFAEIVTADDETIGVALRYFHRSPEEADPELRLYRTYLELQSVKLGGHAYIPTRFIDDYDPTANRITLLSTLQDVEEAGWNRQPDFVARGWGVPEELE